MPKLNILARGVSLNWVALSLSVLVSFFLSPFVIHKLGNIAYGVWTLAGSLISYMGLLDLGLRGAITRFVSRYHSAGRHSEASQAVSTALWFRLGVGFIVIVISVVLSQVASSIFRIPSTLVTAAQWAIIATGMSLAVTLTGGLFAGVLAGLHRFDQLSGTTIGQVLLRTSGVVYLLQSGHGIVALAIWEFTTVLIGNSFLFALCFRQYPQLHISLHSPDRETMRSLWSYSFYAFIINLCIQIVYYTDNLVVGKFVSVEAVTFFAVGGGLIEYLRQLVSSLTTTFTPLASSFDSQGRQDQLQQLLIQGTRIALILALPVEAALMFRGPSFIGLWIGQQYVGISGKVLQILLLAQVFAIANYTSAGVAYGLNKHRPVARWAAGEAIANLALSILLVRRIGILGAAWGTVIPSLLINLLLWPKYACQIASVPLRHYLWQAWCRPALATIPYAAGCFVADRMWHANNLLQFFMQIAALLPLYLLTISFCFRKEAIDLTGRLGWFRAAKTSQLRQPMPQTKSDDYSIEHR